MHGEVPRQKTQRQHKSIPGRLERHHVGQSGHRNKGITNIYSQSSLYSKYFYTNPSQNKENWGGEVFAFFKVGFKSNFYLFLFFSQEPHDLKSVYSIPLNFG